MAIGLKFYFMWMLIMLGLTQTALADNLQRLFTTAEQRLALEQQRLILPPQPILLEEVEEVEEVEQSESPEFTPPAYIAYNGLMRTKQGKLIIWLNGSQELDLEQSGYHIELASDPQNIIIVLTQPAYTKLELRPGEILDTENLRILQAYELEAKKMLDKLMTSSDS